MHALELLSVFQSLEAFRSHQNLLVLRSFVWFDTFLVFVAQKSRRHPRGGFSQDAFLLVRCLSAETRSTTLVFNSIEGTSVWKTDLLFSEDGNKNV